MMDFLKTPVFGILLSVVCYEIGILIQRKTKNPILNPLLLAIILVILVLTVFDIPKETYDLGGSYILFLLGPATVVMAVPLYRQINLLKKDWLPILVGIFVGSATSVLSVIGLARLFGVNIEIVAMGTASHAVGTSKAMELGETQGAMSGLSIGIAGLATVLIIPLVIGLLG